MEIATAIEQLLQFLNKADQDVTWALNTLHTPFTDTAWLFFSNVRIWYIMYLVIVVFFFIRLGWKRALVVTASCILLVVATDQFANLIKHAVCRLRPMEDADMLARGLHVLEKSGGLYGFFSAHAANAMGFAMCSYKGFRNDRTHLYVAYAGFIFTWATLVGLSRVFVAKHYLGDVLVGFVVGLVFGWIIGRIAHVLIKKLKL